MVFFDERLGTEVVCENHTLTIAAHALPMV